MIKSTKEFGAFLKSTREKAGMTQAEASNKIGVSLSFYAAFEQGTDHIKSMKTWRAVSDLFKWTPEQSNKNWDKLIKELASK